MTHHDDEEQRQSLAQSEAAARRFGRKLRDMELANIADGTVAWDAAQGTARSKREHPGKANRKRHKKRQQLAAVLRKARVYT